MGNPVEGSSGSGRVCVGGGGGRERGINCKVCLRCQLLEASLEPALIGNNGIPFPVGTFHHTVLVRRGLGKERWLDPKWGSTCIWVQLCSGMPSSHLCQMQRQQVEVLTPLPHWCILWSLRQLHMALRGHTWLLAYINISAGAQYTSLAFSLFLMQIKVLIIITGLWK